MLHMSQKDYKIQIVEALLKKENHVRGLAKELNTNQTTIARKTKELYQENAADFQMEGKNKVFHLKKTLEAKQYAYIAELHKLKEALQKYPRLRLITENIRKNPKITLALIFGSYAKGTAHKDSDIDLYLETKDKKLKEEVELLDSKLSVKIGLYDPSNLLIKEIEKNHLLIKGIEVYYEKNRFFA